MNRTRSLFSPSAAPLRAARSVLLIGVLAACSEAPQPTAVEKPAAQTGSPAAASDSSAELAAVIEKYARSQVDDDQDVGLKEVTAEAFERDIQAMQQLLGQARQIDTGGLSRDDRIDRRLLIGLLESDIYSAQNRRMWEIDASIYVPAGQVGRLLEPAAEAPAPERAERLLTILGQIPARLDVARSNLRNPPQRFTQAASFKTQGTLKSLRDDGPSLAGESDAGAQVYQQALDRAVAALASFEQFLTEDLLPRSDGTWAVGKTHYDYILAHRWFFEQDSDAILARGKQAFAATEALAQQVSERMEPGKHWAEVYETLKDSHPPADGIKAGYQQHIDAAQRFVIENRIVTLPAGERVVTVDTPPAMRRSSPFGTFQQVDRFGTGLEGKLVLTPVEDWMTPAQQAARLRSHHNAWLPIIAVHEAYPGHHVHALKTRENPRLLRKVVSEPIFSEGWGLFTEELMFELGFLQGDDVRLTQLRNRLWRAARVILDVSLHTGQMTFDEAVDFLVEKVRFERYAAELEVGMYTVRPTYVLGYLIGMEEIAAIRRDWIAANGEPDPPSEFYDQLLRAGSLPPVLVRELLLDSAPDNEDVKYP